MATSLVASIALFDAVFRNATKASDDYVNLIENKAVTKKKTQQASYAIDFRQGDVVHFKHLRQRDHFGKKMYTVQS